MPIDPAINLKNEKCVCFPPVNSRFRIIAAISHRFLRNQPVHQQYLQFDWLILRAAMVCASL